jgi:hypothetical protein
MLRGILGLMCCLGVFSWMFVDGVASPTVGAGELSDYYGGAYCQAAYLIANQCNACLPNGNGAFVKCEPNQESFKCQGYIDVNYHYTPPCNTRTLTCPGFAKTYQYDNCYTGYMGETKCGRPFQADYVGGMSKVVTCPPP